MVAGREEPLNEFKTFVPIQRSRQVPSKPLSSIVNVFGPQLIPRARDFGERFAILRVVFANKSRIYLLISLALLLWCFLI